MSYLSVMKKLLMLFVLFSCGVHAQTNISGNLSGTLTKANSPYLVQGHLMVQPNTTVVIQPGVVIEFQNHFKLNVQGVIRAVGTVTDSITFRINPAMAATGWWGIRFELTPASQDSSILEYCRISGGRATGNGDDLNGGGIFIRGFSKVRVSRCSIFDNHGSNGSGIELHSTAAIIDRNEIRYNSTIGPWSSISGGGIHCDTNCVSRISNNVISSNTVGAGWGGGLGCTSSSPLIINNTISNNESQNQAGGVSFRGTGSATLSNNQVTLNKALSAGGIQVMDITTPLIIGNNISMNVVFNTSGTQAYGGGIMIHQFGGKADILNNYISQNYADADGGGIFLLNCGPLAIVGNTFHANQANVGGGIKLMQARCHMANNVFTNNRADTGAGLYLGPAMTEADLTGNLFANNTAVANGGAVYLESCSSMISNCTFANNYANTMPSYTTYLYGGGGIFLTSASNPTITNCIFWGNRANSQNGHQVYLEDNGSDPPILYSDLEGGFNDIYTNGSVYSGTYSNNIAVNPFFSQPSAGPGQTFTGTAMGWTLQGMSSCINSGKPDTSGLSLPLNDIAGQLRVKGVVDRGAFESPSCGSFVSTPKFVQVGPSFSVTLPGTNIQWLKCNTLDSIKGATGPVYTPTANGSYAVVMFQFGCSGISDCISIQDVGIDSERMEGLEVFPNPARDVLMIGVPDGKSCSVSLYDVHGTEVINQTVEGQHLIDVSSLTQGVYLLVLDGDGSHEVRKIVVE